MQGFTQAFILEDTQRHPGEELTEEGLGHELRHGGNGDVQCKGAGGRGVRKVREVR